MSQGHEPPSGRQAFSIWLDVFRWIAALAVLLGHAHHRVFESFADVPHAMRTVPFFLLSLASSVGTAAVLIFFVLSGFLVGGGTLVRYRQGRFDALEYAVSRLARLWTVLLPTLGITAILLLIQHCMSGRSAFSFDLKIGQIVCNAAFLQTSYACPQYGANGALWSLFNEAWYYAAWPSAMICIFGKHRSMKARLSFGVFACLLLGSLTAFQDIGSSLGIYFTIWLLGVGVAVREKPFLPIGVIPSSILFLGCLLIWQIFRKNEIQGYDVWREYPLDLLIAVSFANLLLAMRACERLLMLPLEAMHKRFAEFSFSLYAIHTPVINFTLAMLVVAWPGLKFPLMPQQHVAYLIYAIVLITSLAAAYFLYLIAERHNYAVRNWALQGARRCGQAILYRNRMGAIDT
jgi:peptidoglycan/LPS O-acetylase OafA/YrhL